MEAALKVLQEGNKEERLKARIYLYEKMLMLEQENARRLGVGTTVHLESLAKELKEIYKELREMQK